MLYAIPWEPSPNFKAGAVGRQIDRVVLHYTVTRDMDSARERLLDPNSEVSAHFLLGREPGEAVQMVRCRDIAWHARNSNARSIGIEMVNIGGLIEDGGKHYQLADGGRHLIRVPDNTEMIRAELPNCPYTLWPTYTDWQYQACGQVCAWLASRFGLKAEQFVGHSYVDPGRKVDPGPAWDWTAFLGIVSAHTERMKKEHVPSVDIPDGVC